MYSCSAQFESFVFPLKTDENDDLRVVGVQKKQ